MLRLKLIIGICMAAGTFLLTISVHAGTYYVATNGSNSNPGTSAKPWQTVAYATNQMGPGDTTYVRGGTYREGQIRFRRSGTSSAPIKLLSASGEFPIIDFVDKASSKQIRFQNSAGLKYPIGWITVEGFQIRNAYNGFKIYNGHDLKILRNSIQNSKSQGVHGNGTRILIERNKINHSGSSTLDHGIYMNGTAITIINNLIYANKCYGIQVNGSASYSSSSHPGPEFANSSNWVISNNTFGYNGCAGIVLWRSTPNARAENNIFYENSVNAASSSTTQGIAFVSTTGSGITIRNNLAYASGSGGAKFLGNATINYTQSGNIVNTLKPAFVNAPATLPSSPNFALPSGSSAIDKGLVISSAKIAYNGTTRPKGSTYDVGAYEYNGSTSQLVLAAPTTAQAQ